MKNNYLSVVLIAFSFYLRISGSEGFILPSDESRTVNELDKDSRFQNVQSENSDDTVNDIVRSVNNEEITKFKLNSNADMNSNKKFSDHFAKKYNAFKGRQLEKFSREITLEKSKGPKELFVSKNVDDNWLGKETPVIEKLGEPSIGEIESKTILNEPEVFDSKYFDDNELRNEIDQFNTNLENALKVTERGIKVGGTKEDEKNKPEKNIPTNVNKQNVNSNDHDGTDNQSDENDNFTVSDESKLDEDADETYYFKSERPQVNSYENKQSNLRPSISKFEDKETKINVEEPKSSTGSSGVHEDGIDFYTGKISERNNFNNNEQRKMIKVSLVNKKIRLDRKELDSSGYKSQTNESFGENNEGRNERTPNKGNSDETRGYRNTAEKSDESSGFDSVEDESVEDLTDDLNTVITNTDVTVEEESEESKEDDTFYNTLVTKIAKMYGYDSAEDTYDNNSAYDSTTNSYDNRSGEKEAVDEENSDEASDDKITRNIRMNKKVTYSSNDDVSRRNINRKSVKEFNANENDDDYIADSSNDKHSDDTDDDNNDELDIDDSTTENDNDNDDDNNDEPDIDDSTTENDNDNDDDDNNNDANKDIYYKDDNNDDDNDENGDDADVDDDGDDDDDNGEEVFVNSRSAQEENGNCAFGWSRSSNGECQPSTTACEEGHVRNYAGECVDPGSGFDKY